MAEEITGKAGDAGHNVGPNARPKTAAQAPAKESKAKEGVKESKDGKGSKETKERILTVNLRTVVAKKPSWRRSIHSARMLKEILKRQTKADDVKIGRSLNEKLWKRGIEKPPGKVRIKITSEDGTVRAELME
jgi:large subunit ribosomal protein L31e